MEEMNSFRAQQCPPQYILDRYVLLWIFGEMKQTPLVSGRKEAEVRLPGNQQLWGPFCPPWCMNTLGDFLLLIYGCAGSLLFCVGFLSLGRVGATLRCGVQPSHCGGFFCCRAQALGRTGFSSCGSLALEHRLSSCGTGA